jgi:hypothetical protein
VSPKLKSLLARITLVGGVALLGAYMARHAPHDQTIAIRFSNRDVQHVEAIVTRRDDDEPTAGFSQDFPDGAPRIVRHTFSAPNGTYIVVITLQSYAGDGAGAPSNNQGKEHPPSAGDVNPKPIETSFQRQVSLAGGEVIVSPD